MDRRSPCERNVLQSGNPGPEARELGGFEPRMMICDNVGMTQCFEQVHFAQYLQKIGCGLTDGYLFDSKAAYIV
jgi:hypothetical protein